MDTITTDRFTIALPHGIELVFAPLTRQQIIRLSAPADDDPKEPQPPEGYTRQQAEEHLTDYQEAIERYQGVRVTMMAMREMGLSRILAKEQGLSTNLDELALNKLVELHGLKPMAEQRTPQAVGLLLWELLTDLGKTEEVFRHFRWQQVVTGQIPEDQVQEVLKSLRSDRERTTDTGNNGEHQPEAKEEGRTANPVKPVLRGRRRSARLEQNAKAVPETTR